MNERLPNAVDFKEFIRAVDSLTLSGRAEIYDDEKEASVLGELYVDPASRGEKIIERISKPQSSLLIGRKGAGKSTIFQKLRQDHLKSSSTACAYFDVRAIFTNAENILDPKTLEALADLKQNPDYAYRLVVARAFIGLTVDALITDLTSRRTSLFQRLKKTVFHDEQRALDKLKELLSVDRYLKGDDIAKIKEVLIKKLDEESADRVDASGILISVQERLAVSGVLGRVSEKGSTKINVEEAAAVFVNYFDYRLFVKDLKSALSAAGIKKLYIVVDDYSELNE